MKKSLLIFCLFTISNSLFSQNEILIEIKKSGAGLTAAVTSPGLNADGKYKVDFTNGGTIKLKSIPAQPLLQISIENLSGNPESKSVFEFSRKFAPGETYEIKFDKNQLCTSEGKMDNKLATKFKISFDKNTEFTFWLSMATSANTRAPSVTY